MLCSQQGHRQRWRQLRVYRPAGRTHRLSSVVIAGGLFVMGVVNSSRNKKSQAQNSPRPPITTSPNRFYVVE